MRYSTIWLLNFAILAVISAIQMINNLQIRHDPFLFYLFLTFKQYASLDLTALLVSVLIFKSYFFIICAFLFTKLYYTIQLISIRQNQKKSTKMTDYGYDKKRFPNLNSENLDCPICTNVVMFPKECSGCGDLFCGKCIDDWTQKSNSCPKRCFGIITNMTSKALIKIYNDLDIQCLYCKKVLKLYDIAKHELNCQKTKCWNYDICSSYEQDEKIFGLSNCSQQCQILDNIMYICIRSRKTGGSVKKMYDILIQFKPSDIAQKSQSLKYPSIGSINYNPGSLRWDETKCGLGMQFENKCELVVLKEPAYVFRTAIGTSGFTSGLHYWEIIPDIRTENELKIGVATSSNFDLNTAFCDHIFGYAYYGLGQLRQNSNASGTQYGKRMKKQGILGIFLNMDKGQLSFSLNGQNMGVAFNNDALKKGPIYPAVALLHCAGCSIRGELPIPHCFK